MHSKLLTLLAVAAIASAQTFLQPAFYMTSVADTSLRVDVQWGGTRPGAPIILTQARMPGDDKSQIWVYDDGVGSLTNYNINGTNIIVTAPVESPGGPIVLGKPVTQDIRNKEGEDLNQIWDYTDDQRVVPLANTSYCLTASGTDVVMAECDENDGDATHRWTLSTGGR